MAYLKHNITFVISLWASLLCVALLTLPLEADGPKRSLYVWKAGVWGLCIASDCGSVGLQNRSVWCIHSEGWSTHESNCFPSERPPHQRVCVQMCEWQKDLFEWHLSPWGPCTPTPFLPANRCVTAQRGVQSRGVQCVKRTNGTTVSPRMCEAFSSAPEREQACLLPCPIDCVVSAFSHWSTCSRTCGSALQQRTRHVLAAPLFGGADCPSLTQTRPCNYDNTHPALCPSDQQEYSYSLWVGPWSPCRVKGKAPIGKTTVDFSFGLDGKQAGKGSYFVKRQTENVYHQNHNDDKRGHKALWEITIGYQTRQLRCTRSDGKNSMLSLCDHDNNPANFRSCVMPRDCKVSDWSTWSPCSKTCRTSDQSPGFRSRYRTLQRAAIGGESCPALEETQRCNILEDTLAFCARYEWSVTKWSPCQVTPLLSQQDHRHSNSSVLCGGGIQTREAYCVKIHNNTAPSHINRPVRRNLCTGPLPTLAQSCSIPCQKHCPLTPWSPWGPCLHDNCLEAQGRRGFRVRKRSVITESWVESHSCPHTTEAMICDDPICFLWRVTSQGPCVPHNGSCGSGTQEQTVGCFSVTGESAPSDRCPGDFPPAQQTCEMACPEDCVLGDWGSWSPCSQSCSSKHFEGRQTRSRPILALPGKQGKPCSPGSELEQWRPCGTNPCTVYYWDTSSWEPCMPDSITDGSERNSTGQMENEDACGTGVQMRQVTCRKAGNGHVVPKRCPESSRPESIRSCVLPCQIDCVVTPFSEWSACPTSCLPVNGTVSTQSRHRIIIQKPANGGQECPDTLYEERECEPPPLCPVYRWQTHRWHQCILVPDSVRHAVGGPTEPCGIGLELRDVTCVGADDAAADISDCMRWAGVMPVQVRECRVPCKNECTFTSWSKFTQCQGCGSWRTRNRSLIGRSKKRWRCQQKELFPLQEKEACPCSEFYTQPQGPWSPCLLHPIKHQAWHPFLQGVYQEGQKAVQDWQAQRKKSECGAGKRYRALACLDHKGRLVEPHLCSSSGYEEEVCHVPCSTDCRLSEWSNWSTCSASCGGGVKVRSQWLREKPFNGGRPCPQLNYKNQVSEVLHCYSQCSQYIWDVTSWSMCIIHPINTNNASTNTTPGQPICGEGLRTRKIRCVKMGGQNPDESVDDSLCDQEEQPITAESCLLPCPTHCVTSEWSQWTKCSVDCNDGDLRWRSRIVLRWPEGDHICPDLNQTQPCNNVTCLKYSYVYSDWSSCQIGENAVCGRGIKTRLLNCVRSDGKLVELSMCKELGPSRGKLSAPCEVGCPVNCLLTEWSNWSECSHTCGNQSQMTRSRVVLQSAGEGGRPCPSQLSQTRSCPIKPCYSWRLGNWSPCRVEGADCGEGVSRREMSCVVHWGSLSGPPQPVPVEDHWCVVTSQSKGSEIELQQPCAIPCPGECHLAKWSPWSSCQLLCLDGRSFEMWGRQARSRAVVTQVAENQDSCPSQVYETQPCQGGTCLSYEWMTGEWRHNRRLVWCQRSDGVNVTGGCIAQNRPSAVKQCHPPCTKPFSFCTQSGVCGCEKGFTEVMTSHGFLDYCTRTPGLDHKKADVKTSAGHVRPEHARNKNQINDWALQPLGPDGRVKLWVYGLMAAGFILILLLIVMSFILCKNPEDSPSSTPQKTMTYDDVDM
nr:thrombospondin type-1 domain-containing protein 7B isoform X1 [Misgurnus anguillicaudatus]XP_055040561.1 thrombospondin type-1 domain-containing protein 7B isoform X1 [Misgurnus anguillicaudatus]XP_055040562.1 thrombospondin type-1 domain-containing protein 7B isoform X1 [Misgurnus anguillicaudatus]XP_055040563.1 thrombospondin type-1 domain-containing protein 7B isoform X1 [Misgurnus anguillicaudatus]